MIQFRRCLNTDMKKIFSIIAVCTLVALGGAIAQEAAEEAEQESAAQSEANDGEDETTEPASPDEVFVPSERISADQEVIFPVDI